MNKQPTTECTECGGSGDKAIVRCAERFMSGFNRINELPEFLLNPNKFSEDKRKKRKNKALDELNKDLIGDFGIKTYFESMESINRVISK